MKKKVRRHIVHHHRRSVARPRVDQNYLIVVRGWMFIVLFAIMLGVGAIVGNFLNQQLSTPQVAGAQISR